MLRCESAEGLTAKQLGNLVKMIQEYWKGILNICVTSGPKQSAVKYGGVARPTAHA